MLDFYHTVNRIVFSLLLIRNTTFHFLFKHFNMEIKWLTFDPVTEKNSYLRWPPSLHPTIVRSKESELQWFVLQNVTVFQSGTWLQHHSCEVTVLHTRPHFKFVRNSEISVGLQEEKCKVILKLLRKDKIITKNTILT